ncbi:DUF4870 domain-containing protein [Flavobacterium humi]|uniref:DUF4870 domain-containing protein n=1 Tax=Flavobacterium humi TaxID=2562683 RepID=A0A4Z0LB32_9FLAO|nr:DUF4870 domain-containing protein [Flavobacterium humi]TGD59123.1 DUF4870 domain-containing protein [Flavobacterium humi]
MTTTQEKNTATLIHLSTLTQFFFPFGNYLFPMLIWSFKKDKSEFVDHNGKQTLNFQLSLLLYTIVLAFIAIPTLLYSIFNNVTFDQFENGDFAIEQLSAGNITGILVIGLTSLFILCILKVVEFFLVIYAAVKSNNGERYRYPLAINFLK